MGLEHGLIWQRDEAGYELRAEEPPVYPAGATRLIVPRGGEIVAYQPLLFGSLYTRFASIHTLDDLLRFTNEYGLLTKSAEEAKQGEDALYNIKVAQVFRLTLRNVSQVTDIMSELPTTLGQLEVILTRDQKTGKPQLQYRPPTLLLALWLQLGRAMTGDIPTRECRYCREFFEVGPRSTPHRRIDADFCEEDHRVAFHNRNRPRKGAANV